MASTTKKPPKKSPSETRGTKRGSRRGAVASTRVPSSDGSGRKPKKSQKETHAFNVHRSAGRTVEEAYTGKAVKQADLEGGVHVDVVHPGGAGWHLSGEVIRVCEGRLLLTWTWERLR